MNVQLEGVSSLSLSKFFFVELIPNAGSELHRHQVVGIMVMLLGQSEIQIIAGQR